VSGGSAICVPRIAYMASMGMAVSGLSLAPVARFAPVGACPRFAALAFEACLAFLA
jgi:hypothetical protein